MTESARTAVTYIPVSAPIIGDREIAWVHQALSEGAISGLYGSALSEFERRVAVQTGCAHAVTTTSGTTALHLAVAALGIGAGDEVLVSTLTNMATIFAILYQGATPVPIDIEPDTWNLDPSLLDARVTQRTKAILVVHLFGHPVDMDPVLDLARRRGLRVIEDCAEAQGAIYRGQPVGSLGDIGCFSFYANKIITTGEGGMVTTNDAELADRCRSLKCLAFGRDNKFLHQAVGFNYRMTNLQAALGCAQMERIASIIAAKRSIAAAYTTGLSGTPCLQLPVELAYAQSVWWMYHVELTGAAASHRREIMTALAARGIESREGFVPANDQPIFQAQGWTSAGDCPRASRTANSTFYLPSGPQLTSEQITYVTDALRETLARGC